MGKSEFRNFLDKKFGYCHENALPANAQVDLVIDEVEIGLFKLTSACPEDLTFEELGERFRRRMLLVQNRHPGLTCYVCLFDEKEFVPKAKHPTQRERAATSRKAGKVPFTIEEAQMVRIALDEDIPSPKKTFWEKLLITSFLRDEFNSFCAREIAKTPFLPPPPEYGEDHVSIIVDSVRVSSESFRAAGIDVANGVEGDDQATEKFILQCLPSSTADEPVKCVKVESKRIGESDQKIGDYVSHYRKHDVLVCTTDTDTICTLLLNMRNWISRKTGRFESNIYVQMTGSRETNEGSIVDMCSLWRSIMMYFGNKFPNVTNPVETVVLFMLLCKTDFTDGFSQLGYVKLWQAFEARGQNILYNANGGPGVIIMQNGYGDEERECPCYDVMLGEDRVYRFLEYAWHRILIDRKKKNSTAPPCQMIAIREMARIKNQQLVAAREKKHAEQMQMTHAKNPEIERQKVLAKINKPYYVIPSDDEIYAQIRRIAWTLDYFMNGFKVSRDSLERENGLSKWGWELQTVEGDEHKTRVERAKRIFVLGNNAMVLKRKRA